MSDVVVEPGFPSITTWADRVGLAASTMGRLPSSCRRSSCSWPIRWWLRNSSPAPATITAGPSFAFELCLKAAGDSSRQILGSPVPQGGDERSRARGTRARSGGFRSVLPAVPARSDEAGPTALPSAPSASPFRRWGRGCGSGQSPSPHAEGGPSDDATAFEFVACGQPLPGHQIRIVGEARAPAARRRRASQGPLGNIGVFQKPREDSRPSSTASGSRAEIVPTSQGVTSSSPAGSRT